MLTDDLFTLLVFTIERRPANGQQLRFLLTLFRFQFFVFFGCLSLALQVSKLTFQLIPNIGQPLKVFLGTSHPVFGFAASVFVFRNPCSFFDINTQFFWLGFDQARNHALLDNRIRTRAQTGAKKDIGNVLTAALSAIQVISRLTISGDLSADTDFIVLRILATQSAIGVIEYQINTCLTDRFTFRGAVKNNVGHGVATQVLGGTFPHYPTDRIDGI